MNRLAPLVAAALAAPCLSQVPDTEPLLAADQNGTAPGSISLLTELVAGEDEGWVALARVVGPGGAETSGIVGALADDDPAGPRVLRLPMVLAGIDQQALFAPRLAGGRLGYVSAAGVASAAWIDDTLIARTGDPAGMSGGTWSGIQRVVPLTGGDAVVVGLVNSSGANATRRVIVHHPSGAVLLSDGQSIPGTSETLQAFPFFDLSPSGNHLVAVGRLLPSLDSVVLLDGAIHQIQPNVEARSGQDTVGTLPAPASGAFGDFQAAYVTDSGRVVLEAAIDLPTVGRRDSVIRDGREIAADGPPLLGIDAHGGTLSGLRSSDLSILHYEGEDIGMTRSGLDVDDDGVADPLVQVRTSFQSAVISGSGRVYGLALVFDNRTGAPVTAPTVLASVRKEAPQVVCAGQPNFRGVVAHLEAVGSRWAGYNRMRIVATGLPWNSFGLPLVSRTAAGPMPLPGSMGELCLGGAIGRMPFATIASGFPGGGADDLYLNLFPQGNGYVSVLPGETWYLQMWYRDVQGQVVSSNLTDAIAVSFR